MLVALRPSWLKLQKDIRVRLKETCGPRAPAPWIAGKSPCLRIEFLLPTQMTLLGAHIIRVEGKPPPQGLKSFGVFRFFF